MTQYGVTIKSGSKMAAILDTPSWIFFILVEPLKFAKIDQKVTEDNKRTRWWYKNVQLTSEKLFFFNEKVKI